MLHLVFVGIVGTQHKAVEHQLEPALKKLGITERAVPERELVAIVKNTPASKKLVSSLHVGGVVAGQLTGAGSSRSFRVVIYDGQGNLVSDIESPIGARSLTKGDISMFETNVEDIAGAPASGSPAGSGGSVASSQSDDDAPPGMGGTTTAAAASPDDGDDTAATPKVVDHTAPAGGHAIHVRVGLLAGLVGRDLAVEPNTIKMYTSDPVGTAGIEGALTIGPRAQLHGSFEHTLVMHTDVANGGASSDIGRFELVASYDVLHGNVNVAPALGYGMRYFQVDSTSTDRSPDVEYDYVLLGATVSKHFGPRWTLRGLAAFEPVVGGLPPGPPPAPSRWGFDLGAALEVQATKHVFARAALDYQSFSSSWMMGGAIDAYPTGSASAGAVF